MAITYSNVSQSRLQNGIAFNNTGSTLDLVNDMGSSLNLTFASTFYNIQGYVDQGLNLSPALLPAFLSSPLGFNAGANRSIGYTLGNEIGAMITGDSNHFVNSILGSLGMVTQRIFTAGKLGDSALMNNAVLSGIGGLSMAKTAGATVLDFIKTGREVRRNSLTNPLRQIEKLDGSLYMDRLRSHSSTPMNYADINNMTSMMKTVESNMVNIQHPAINYLNRISRR